MMIDLILLTFVVCVFIGGFLVSKKYSTIENFTAAMKKKIAEWLA